jgi:hypothetical protein
LRVGTNKTTLEHVVNDFGIDLKGLQVVVKSQTFYKPNTSVKDRTFKCEGGIGCSPAEGTRRTITGRWLDGAKDTISSYDAEAYIDAQGKTVKRPKEKQFEDMIVAPEPEAVEVKASKPRGRSAWKSQGEDAQ